MKIKLVEMWICQACLDGIGEECHTPGCALFLHRVDLPIMRELYHVKAEHDEGEFAEPAPSRSKTERRP